MEDYNDARTKSQNRTNLMQLKLIGQSHPTGLTANLLKLFGPRPPLEYKSPLEKWKCPPYTGMAQFVENFAEPGDPEYAPPVPEVETTVERRARIHKRRLEEGAKKAVEELEKYDPNSDPNIPGDPYKTLFVTKLNYETTEGRIKREFEAYGPIKRVHLVTDKTTNKPRGYAFIEYMHTRDMKAAYKQADGKKIDNRRVLVDVERGRTVPNWRPRRLGGGLGTTRVGTTRAGGEVTQRGELRSGVTSRSEEPRIRDERDREKSRDRGKERDREREKSRERSHDRPRGRDYRDDRRHGDRDRKRGRDYDRDQDRGRDRKRDRDQGRDRGMDYVRDRDRGRHHERERDRDWDYEGGDIDDVRGRSRDREYDYDHHVESKHYRDHEFNRERTHDGEPEDDGVYEQHEHRLKQPEAEHDHRRYGYYDRHQVGGYDNPDTYVDDDRYKDPEHDDDRNNQKEEDNYQYDHVASESQERGRDCKRSDRSRSREYGY